MYKDEALSPPTVFRWLNRFILIVLDDDSDEKDIPLPCVQSFSDAVV